MAEWIKFEELEKNSGLNHKIVDNFMLCRTISGSPADACKLLGRKQGDCNGCSFNKINEEEEIINKYTSSTGSIDFKSVFTEMQELAMLNVVLG